MVAFNTNLHLGNILKQKHKIICWIDTEDKQNSPSWNFTKFGFDNSGPSLTMQWFDYIHSLHFSLAVYCSSQWKIKFMQMFSLVLAVNRFAWKMDVFVENGSTAACSSGKGVKFSIFFVRQVFETFSRLCSTTQMVTMLQSNNTNWLTPQPSLACPTPNSWQGQILSFHPALSRKEIWGQGSAFVEFSTKSTQIIFEAVPNANLHELDPMGELNSFQRMCENGVTPFSSLSPPWLGLQLTVGNPSPAALAGRPTFLRLLPPCNVECSTQDMSHKYSTQLYTVSCRLSRKKLGPK